MHKQVLLCILYSTLHILGIVYWVVYYTANAYLKTGSVVIFKQQQKTCPVCDSASISFYEWLVGTFFFSLGFFFVFVTHFLSGVIISSLRSGCIPLCHRSQWHMAHSWLTRCGLFMSTLKIRSLHSCFLPDTVWMSSCDWEYCFAGELVSFLVPARFLCCEDDLVLYHQMSHVDNEQEGVRYKRKEVDFVRNWML